MTETALGTVPLENVRERGCLRPHDTPPLEEPLVLSVLYLPQHPSALSLRGIATTYLTHCPFPLPLDTSPSALQYLMGQVRPALGLAQLQPPQGDPCHLAPPLAWVHPHPGRAPLLWSLRLVADSLEAAVSGVITSSGEDDAAACGRCGGPGTAD